MDVLLFYLVKGIYEILVMKINQIMVVMYTTRQIAKCHTVLCKLVGTLKVLASLGVASLSK